MAHDVFVSYSSKDKPTADAVCAVLESHGIRCWVAPRDILPGSDWGGSIIEAIRCARAMVLIFSANANASPQIKREVERAVNKGIPVIPLRIEDVVPTASLEYFISTPHWLDAFTPPLERHLQYLAEVVGKIVGRLEVSIPPSLFEIESREKAEAEAARAAEEKRKAAEDAGRTRLSEEQRTDRRGQQKSETKPARKEHIGRTQSTQRVGLFVAVGVLVVGIATVSSWYFGFFRSLGKTSTVVTTQPSVVESRASPKISAPIQTPVPPTAARIEAPSVPELPTRPAGPKVIANTVYEGTIHVKNDSSTNVPLVITIGSDLKSGTMTQSGHHGDVVVKFTGGWDGATLHAVTDEIVSIPKGINWDPESFTLHFAEDNKSATYECFADGKTYVADLSAQAAPVVKAAPTYKGTILARGENGLGTPLTINLAADRKSGTMTQSSRHGDVVVKFTGVWDGDILRAVTNEVISKPKNIQWKPESFTLRFTADGKRGSYECNSEGHLYTAELSQP
jgi:TIR domain